MPPNDMPLWMRVLPQPPTSPQSISTTSLPEPDLLEWHPSTSSQEPPCLYLGEITNLKAWVDTSSVKYKITLNVDQKCSRTGADCLLNIEIQQDLNRVSTECNESGQTVGDLVQYDRWQELRHQDEEDDRRTLEDLMNLRTVAAEQHVHEQITQLRAKLEHELLTRPADISRYIEAETTPFPLPMDIEKLTTEEFLEILEPNRGLNEN
jgi:hypothetical protein